MPDGKEANSQLNCPTLTSNTLCIRPVCEDTARFLHVSNEVPASCWTVLSLMLLMCFPFAWLHNVDRLDWINPSENVQAYLKAARRMRRSRFACWQIFAWIGKSPTRAPSRRHHMAMTAFGEVPAVAKLLAPSLSGAIELHVAYSLSFRVGRPVVINPGGETEERRAIAKFTLAGVVVKDPLAHRHCVGERVQQDIVPLQPSQVFGQVSEAPKETEQAEDDVEQDLLHRDTSAASGSGGIAMVPTSLVTDTCSSGEVVDLDQFEEVEDLENIMQAIMCPKLSDRMFPCGAALATATSLDGNLQKL